ncbi:MAG: DUF2963 domain-containing protein [Candidatus Phytoplasma sp. TWB_XP]
MIKNKKIIFIIWGFVISFVMIVLLTLLLLSLQPKSSPQSFNQPVEAKPIQSSAQQEQETYNNILNKIEKEVNELTNIKEIVYCPDGKTIKHIKILDSETKKEIKRIFYHDDGKRIYFINEYNPEGKLIKETDYDVDGKIIEHIIEFTPEKKPIKETYYNPDGTVKEVINF